MWIRDPLVELNVAQEDLVLTLQENFVTNSWTEEMQGLWKVKHIGIKYQYVQYAVRSGTVQVDHTPSCKNRAGSLTKVLAGEDFWKHRGWFGVIALAYNNETFQD